MNIFTIIALYAGGPGSGCTGPNCGRRPDFSKVVTVDFDHTIANHPPGQYDLGSITPLKNGLELLRELGRQGYKVYILTARDSSYFDGIKEWLKSNGIDHVQVTNTKIPAVAYVDDRALNWTGNQPVEEAMSQINKMSEIKQAKDKQAMERFAQMGTR